MRHLQPLPRQPPLMPDTVQNDDHTRHTGEKRHQIRRPIALQAVRALAMPAPPHHRMSIVNGAVQQVKDIPAHDWCEGHGPPILAQACYTERICNEARVHAEQQPISKASERAHDVQEVRV